MGNVFHVTTLADSGPGSFRQGIIESNIDSKVLVFDLAGTITLQSDLPKITNKIIINGKSAPGFITNPVVQIECNSFKGLIFTNDDTDKFKTSDTSEIYSISITNSKCAGISIFSNLLTLDGNFVGLNMDNTVNGCQGDGIFISESFGHKIGLNPTFISSYISNTVSGNYENGINIYKSFGISIISNVIGLDFTEVGPYPNHKNGINIIESTDIMIGGDVYTNSDSITNNPTGSKGTVPPVFIILPLSNDISGNVGDGIFIDKCCKNIDILGNYIGSGSDGNGGVRSFQPTSGPHISSDTPPPSNNPGTTPSSDTIIYLGNQGNGVNINNSTKINLIGCKIINEPFVYYNVISGNALNGLKVSNSNDITIQANFFGIGADNDTIVPNLLDGVLIDGNSKDIVFGGVIPLGNNSSGNLKNGLEVLDCVSNMTVFNLFAGTFSFGDAAPNGKNGIAIKSKGGNINIRTCILSGNVENGIKISGCASGINIDPCIIGLNARANGVIPNMKNGVLICDKASKISVSSNKMSIIVNSAISGNLESGISIRDDASKITINGSAIGLDLSMLNAFSNGKYGIELRGKSNKIIVNDNNISGNILNGIIINKDVNKVLIKDNTIGKNRLGVLMPNALPQILNLSEGDIVIKGNN